MMQKIYDPMISLNLDDWGIPGVVIELTQNDTETLGAFSEEALTEADVLDVEIEEEDL
jgi:hypothetical protein